MLTNDVLRNTFGLGEGMIVSDCGAVSGILHSHHYTDTNSSTIEAALVSERLLLSFFFFAGGWSFVHCFCFIFVIFEKLKLHTTRRW